MADPYAYRHPKEKAEMLARIKTPRTDAVTAGLSEDLANYQGTGAGKAGLAVRGGLATIPAAIGDTFAPVVQGVNEGIITPLAEFGRELFNIQPDQSAPQPEIPTPAGAPKPNTTAPVAPDVPVDSEAEFRKKYEEALRNHVPRSIEGPTFTRPVKQRNPLAGVALPQLSGNVNLNDLMSFRLGLINAGIQTLPRVAQAAADKTQRETMKDEAALRLKQLELGQSQDIARANMYSKGLDRAARLEAAKIRAAGNPDGMYEIMRDLTAGNEYEDLQPTSAADQYGNTVATFTRNLSSVYPAEQVYLASRRLQEQAAQKGEVDLSKPESAMRFNQLLAQELDRMYPGRVKVPEVAQP